MDDKKQKVEFKMNFPGLASDFSFYIKNGEIPYINSDTRTIMDNNSVKKSRIRGQMDGL